MAPHFPPYKSFLTQFHSTSLEKCSVNTLVEKLRAIGGDGKLAECEWRIRNRCGWHRKAQSTVRHLIYQERRATAEEEKQIEAAHLKWCAEKIEANRLESAVLFETIHRAIAAMEAGDPAFYQPQIDALRELVDRNWGASGKDGEKN